MKKSLLALAGITLALVFGTGVLYSVGNGTQEVTVQLPENKSGEFGLRTVADGKLCVCKFQANKGRWVTEEQKLYGREFHSAQNCEAKCEDMCKERYDKPKSGYKFEEAWCE
jgi:hypothetical protein